AARWVGLFHRFHDARPHTAAVALNEHDERYFAACANRALSNVSRRGGPAWLARLGEYFGRRCVPKLLQRRTIIHGEFYPENVLIDGDIVYPVDWERAALSAGEIDIAALTEGQWEPRTVEDAIDAYIRARW